MTINSDTRATLGSTTRPPTTALADTLTEALFEDGPDGVQVHAHWREAVSAELFRYRPEADVEERWQLAYGRLRALNDELPLPAEQLADDPRRLAALHEWAAVVDGATATVAGIHYNLFLGSLLDDDVSAPRDLTDFASLTRTGTFLCTERGHGNDAAALETVARYDRERDEFVLHTPHEGAAKYMPNTSPAGGPKTAVVAARLLMDDQDEAAVRERAGIRRQGTLQDQDQDPDRDRDRDQAPVQTQRAPRDHGVFLFLTPLTDRLGPLPGVTVTGLPERIGSPVDHCVTSFDHVRLPRTALVQGAHGQLLPDGTFTSTVGSPRKRFLHAISRVTVGKLCMSASALGGCRAALTTAVRYAHLRRISGPVAGQRVPLAAHRSHHARLLERVATAYAMTFLHRTVTDRWITHAPEERAAAERLVAVTKGWITWQTRDITIESRERCGARALFPVNGLAEYPANTEGAITAEGDNLAIWCKAGAEMIFGHELAAEPAEATGEESLTDPAFLRRAVTAAERQWHQAARRDLRRGDGGDALGRWNNASAAALDLVETYAIGQAADAFLSAIARVTEPPARAVLTDLCALFLLGHVKRLSGPLLIERALTPDQVRSVPQTLHDLTARLAPHLLVLAEAFDVPEKHLASLPMLTDIPAPRS
ncbi:acyl-CoA dehydrogenase [Streptomyces sp. NPDC005808]|uniref:acyl-CoA dehydrogenase family protein n=1 Tax=Streptomyces sp. NPDC005808 TaxID=3364734 RepID=UPI0036B0EC72